ncbi:MAG: hypothetical protein IPN59_01705 [Holophaga sp.]|nr:hypothetical protein [Holophaga sp.]
MLISFTLGCLCGLAMGIGGCLLKGRLHNPLGEDEKYLLAAARAANGRLILRQEKASSGTPLLLLKEYPNPRRMEAHGQIDQLLKRKLLIPDPSGIPDRYQLTPAGRQRSEQLPEFPLQPVRQGSWFNSISRPPQRFVRRS